MRQLLKNANIYDGTGAPAFRGDVLIEDDRIVKVGTDLTDPADRVTDLKGLSLAPGFIDGHSHNDWFAIKNDPLPYFEPFIRQGIATFVTGNCGISETGFEPGCEHVDLMGAGLFHFDKTTGEYGDMDSFFEAIDRNTPCNIAALVGHCSARAAVSGSVNRQLTEEETTKMLAILEKNLQQGAAGISLGLMYALLCFVLHLAALTAEFAAMGPWLLAAFWAGLVLCMFLYDRLLLPMSLLYWNRVRPKLKFLRRN